MIKRGRQSTLGKCGAALISVVALTLLFGVFSPATAFQLFEGDVWSAQLDTTVSYGLMWRVSDRDEAIVGIANGGEFYGVNNDDGNLNYGKGLVSNAAKITSELEIGTSSFGGFFRGTGFYDFENMDGDRERTALSDEAEDAVGRDVELLDAFVWAQMNLGTVPLQVRVGDQVVSWGESTFYGNSINAINPIDVSKIRVPGAELKEALMPEGMVWASVDATENISFEGLYLYDWEPFQLDEPGTYFSTADFISNGGNKIMLGSGAVPDNGNAPAALTPMAVARLDDNEPDDQGQFGVALRWYVPSLNDTELGFFYIKVHSRLPYISAVTGDPSVITDPALALPQYVSTARYRLDYPEDLKIYGASFSTTLFDMAWQGEASYHQDMPLQIDDAEILLAALSPLNPAFAALGQLGGYAPNQEIIGYIEKDVVQIQSTLTKILDPVLGASGGVILGEVALMHVRGMPGKDELRLEGPATVTPGSAAAAAAISQPGFPVPPEGAEHFADQNSWGYTVLAMLDYDNAFGSLNISPRVSFRHDVRGVSPSGGAFLENRRSIAVGLTTSYQSLSADISYTNFFGAGSHNLENDRDMVGFNVKYSF